MGAGGQKREMHEIDATRAATRDHAFDELIERIKSAGGEITQDETHPLYIDIGMEEAEIGTERIVEFNLNKMDFKLIRKSETHRIDGAGHNKSLVPMEAPRIKMTLRRKPEISDDWQIVDLDDMF